jgi:hypothetical protein
MIHCRLLTLVWLLPAAPVFAEDLVKSTDNDIVVYGRAIEQIGVASSASEGTVGYKDFEQRPLSRVGEMAENVPGHACPMSIGPSAPEIIKFVTHAA